MIIGEITPQMQNILIYLIGGMVLLTNGCALHRPDVQQGNVLAPEMLAQIHTGLSKKQVKFLLGTPIVNDLFHPDRWDYVYLMNSQDTAPVQQRLTLFFDNDVLSRMETVGVTIPPPAVPPANQ